MLMHVNKGFITIQAFIINHERKLFQLYKNPQKIPQFLSNFVIFRKEKKFFKL